MRVSYTKKKMWLPRIVVFDALRLLPDQIFPDRLINTFVVLQKR